MAEEVHTDAEALELLEELLPLTDVPERVGELIHSYEQWYKTKGYFTRAQRNKIGELYDEYA